METWDAVIVGAGPAGLTAATYLARFRRRVLVIGDGPTRASWIPESHNTPGFPRGVDGPTLIGRMTEQALEFGANLRRDEVREIGEAGEGFEILGSGETVRASTVLLATGVVDQLPAIEGIEAAIRRSQVRICPICDAFEAIDRRIAVLGHGAFAEREAQFLRTYSNKVASFALDTVEIELEDEAVAVIENGERRAFDHLYLALGVSPQSGLATTLGARQDADGNLLVDHHQMTTVHGLFAAGDVVRGLNQISVATGEAAIAATAMHNLLRDRGG